MEKKKFVRPETVSTKQHPNEEIMSRDILTQETARSAGEIAHRDPIRERYDILDPEFLRFMALIAGYGAKKYGEKNWHKSRLTGDKSPINHIMKHLVAYQNEEPYDHSEISSERCMHLVAIAFNAMMECYHEFRGTDYDDIE